VASLEKENFADRSEESFYRDKISEGDIVLICEKHMQKTACKKEHLTEGVVWEKLTGSSYHSRGIKVRLMSGEVGRVIYLVRKLDSSSDV